MRTKLSLFCSFVLPCLGLMQQCAATEFMISPQIDDAYEQLRTMIVSSITAAVPTTRKGAKFQEPIPEETPFPCDTSPGSPGAPSPTRPNSVHKLRPGDINVVGAMGDSTTAASGAASVNLLQGLIENRGLSFAIGEEEKGPLRHFTEGGTIICLLLIFVLTSTCIKITV